MIDKCREPGRILVAQLAGERISYDGQGDGNR